MEYEHESELAREAKALLLDLINRVVPYTNYKGAVAFLPGDARIIKKKIIKVNNLLADHISLPVWPDVVMPSEKDELRRLLPKLTDRQQSCITHYCYGHDMEMTIDNSTIARAISAARKAVEANERAEEDIVSALST